jgi:hypothetical protein
VAHCIILLVLYIIYKIQLLTCVLLCGINATQLVTLVFVTERLGLCSCYVCIGSGRGHVGW